MAHAERVGDRIVLESEYREKDQCRMVPGASWSEKERRWSLPLSWGGCKVLRGVFGQNLTLGPNLVAWATEKKWRVDDLLAHRDLVQYETESKGAFFESLYPFQVVGVDFIRAALHHNGGVLLGDEMGSGKTIQTIRALSSIDAYETVFPMLVVCPNSMKLTWAKEFKRWWVENHPTGEPPVEVIVLKGGAAQRRKQLEHLGPDSRAVVILNWEAARLHSRISGYGSIALRRCPLHGGESEGENVVSEAQCDVHPRELNRFPFTTIVVDEAHRMIHPQARQTRAVWWLGDGSQFRVALTGTPISSTPDQLYSIMRFLSPLEYPSKTRYIDRYALTSWNPFGGLDIVGLRPDTREEFFAILDPQFRRMPKEATLPFLPPKIREVRYAEMSAKQAKAYKQMKEHMISLLDDNVLTTANALTQMTRLTQFSSSFAQIDDAGNVVLTDPSNKLDELEDILEDTGNESLVVFAQSRQLIMLAAERLKKKGVTYRLIVGGMTPEDRERSMVEFQAGKVRVILATIAAGGVGITLTKAGIAVFLQRSWSMIDNKQAEDRVHRIGSEIHDKITIIDIVAPDTVEETQIEALEGKAEHLEEITRDRVLLRKLLEKGTVAA